MPEDQEAKNEACHKARRTRPEGQKNKARGPEEQGQQGQKRPRAGDLAKERIRTEKFQQIEQQGVGCLQMQNCNQKTNPGGGKT
jgi:hypothetical protein